MEEFFQKEKIDLYQDKQALQRIIEASEKAKIELSTLQSIHINIPFITIENQIPKHIDLQFDRSKFENLSSSLLQRCYQPLEKALQDAKLKKADIAEIILVGGSTRIPAVRNLLIDYLGKPLNETVNPDEVVALGAAVQAGIIGGEITDLVLLDVTPLSLGVETAGGLMTPLIRRNTAIPLKQSEVFSTASDNQDAVDINVLQGERVLAKDNRSLGIFQLQDIPPAPRGVPKIKVTFQLDVNGILSVTATNQQTGKEQSIEIQGASVMPREDVAKLIEEAEQNVLSDKSQKTFVNLTFELDLLFEKIEFLMEELLPQLTNELERKEKNESSLSFEKIVSYLIQTTERLKIAYIDRNFSEIDTILKVHFPFLEELFVYDFLEKSLNTEDSSKGSSKRTNVIDV